MSRLDALYDEINRYYMRMRMLDGSQSFGMVSSAQLAEWSELKKRVQLLQAVIDSETRDA